MPFFSVIITTFDRPVFLRRLVFSVLAQTYRDFEVIIVDDCPERPARSAVADLESLAPIRYELNEENVGRSVARNRGAQRARGQYVCFSDDDDILYPDSLLTAHQMLQQGAPWGYRGWEWRLDATAALEKTRLPDRRGEIDRLPRWAFNVITDLVVRRDLAVANPFDASCSCYEIKDWLARLYRVGNPVFTSYLAASCRTHHGFRTSSRATGLKLEELRRLRERHRSLIESHPRGNAHFWFLQAAMELAVGQRPAAYRSLLRACLASPSYVLRRLRKRLRRHASGGKSDTVFSS